MGSVSEVPHIPYPSWGLPERSDIPQGCRLSRIPALQRVTTHGIACPAPATDRTARGEH